MNKLLLIAALACLVALVLRATRKPELRIAFQRGAQRIPGGTVPSMNVDQPEQFKAVVVDKFGNALPDVTLQNITWSDTNLATLTPDPGDPASITFAPTGALGTDTLSVIGDVALTDGTTQTLDGSLSVTIVAGAPASIQIQDAGPASAAAAGSTTPSSTTTPAAPAAQN
jgi:hypothetical protein